MSLHQLTLDDAPRYEAPALPEAPGRAETTPAPQDTAPALQAAPAPAMDSLAGLPDDLATLGFRLYPNGVYIFAPTPGQVGLSFAHRTLEANVAAAHEWLRVRERVSASEAERAAKLAEKAAKAARKGKRRVA